jgi:hypothetical protein
MGFYIKVFEDDLKGNIMKFDLHKIAFPLILGLLVFSVCAAGTAQDTEQMVSKEATTAKVETGNEQKLGGFFAATLQDILKKKTARKKRKSLN